MAKVNEEEMNALASITPKNEDVDVQKSDLGIVDLSPKIKRDERLQQLEFVETSRDKMNYGAKFYPSDWIFKVRAALGAEIASFSTIDNEDPLSVNDGINEILKSCLRIESKSGKVYSYKNLYEMDRLWFLLYIRDLTMVNTEQKIEFKVNCDKCNEVNTVALTWDILMTIPFTELGNKYFDENENAFCVVTKTYGILKFQPSTIYRADLFKDWLIEQQQKKNKINTSFVKLFWMLVNSDNEKSKDCIRTAYANFIALSNDTKKLSLYMKLNDELQVGLTQKMSFICSACDKEAQADITFPNGISNILLMSDIDSELL